MSGRKDVEFGNGAYGWISINAFDDLTITEDHDEVIGGAFCGVLRKVP